MREARRGLLDDVELGDGAPLVIVGNVNVAPSPVRNAAVTSGGSVLTTAR